MHSPISSLNSSSSSSSDKIPTLQKLSATAFYHCEPTNPDLFNTFAKDNFGSHQQIFALQNLKSMPLEEIVTLPLFDEACDEYAYLIISSMCDLPCMLKVFTSQSPAVQGRVFVNLIRLSQNVQLSYEIRDSLLHTIHYLNSQFCFININLSGSNLSGLSLAGLDLSTVDLSGADLSFTNLSGTILEFANLEYTNLQYANMHKAYIAYANLRNADLSNATMTDMSLNYANLTNATLNDVNLSRSWLYHTILDHANLSNANLDSACLSKSTLICTNLSYANLSNATTNGIHLYNTILDETILPENVHLSSGASNQYGNKDKHNRCIIS